MVLSGKKNRWYSQGRIQRNHGFRGREIQRGQRPFWHRTLRAKSSVLYLYEADRIRKEDSKAWTILIKIICFIKRNSFPSCFSNDEAVNSWSEFITEGRFIDICTVTRAYSGAHAGADCFVVCGRRVCSCAEQRHRA